MVFYTFLVGFETALDLESEDLGSTRLTVINKAYSGIGQIEILQVFVFKSIK